MLPELFQDDEKAISPTSATSSGRTLLTRTPAKATKGRPGQMAKEHKKTVGHQVSSGSCCCHTPPPLLTWSLRSSFASWVGFSGEERLDHPLWEQITLPTQYFSLPTLDPCLHVCLSQNNFLYVLILLLRIISLRPLQSSLHFLVALSLYVYRAAVSSFSTRKCPLLPLMSHPLWGVGNVTHMLWKGDFNTSQHSMFSCVWDPVPV